MSSKNKKEIKVKMKYSEPNHILIHKNYDYPIKSFLNGEGQWTYTDQTNHGVTYKIIYECKHNGKQCRAYVHGKKYPVSQIKPFDLLNIDTWKKIYYYQEGQNDFKEWIVAFQTKDGIYVYFRASCDYTGFDCQGGGDISFTKDRDIFWNFCLDQFGRNLILEQSGIKMKIEIGGSLNKYWKKHKNN